MVIDMRNVNLEKIRKELYTNLNEMYFGTFYHMTELKNIYYDICETNEFKLKKLSNCLEIKHSKAFSDYEYSFYITVEDYGVHCYSNNSDDKCFNFKWCVYYADVKNRTQLFMEVVKKLTMELLK